MPISGVTARVDDDLIFDIKKAYLFPEQDLANIGFFV
jgi:hypothetical protein